MGHVNNVPCPPYVRAGSDAKRLDTVALVDRGWPETGRMTARRMTSVFAGFRFLQEVISLAVRWYLRYGLSYRDVEELLAERGITVDDSFAAAFCRLARQNADSSLLQDNRPRSHPMLCCLAVHAAASRLSFGITICAPQLPPGVSVQPMVQRKARTSSQQAMVLLRK
jgi:hypothetical protein